EVRISVPLGFTGKESLILRRPLVAIDRPTGEARSVGDLWGVVVPKQPGLEDTRDAETLRVIVVDDDPLSRRVVRDSLQAAGIVVIAEASGGREAVQLAAYYKPDVVVMDL